MIVSLITSFTRVTFFWYLLGLLVLFIGNPDWAEKRYAKLMHYPGVPHLTMHGLGTAAEVQLNLLMFWTVPMLVLWVGGLGVGYLITDLRMRRAQRQRELSLKPTGEFWGVTIPSYSLGALPPATTPKLTGQPVVFSQKEKAPRGAMFIDIKGVVGEAFKMLTAAENQLAQELLQLLLAQPDHYAGAGHGVGLLEHTLNVVGEAAPRCTLEFRMPLLAALAHDVGKLITFARDKDGEWVRRGFHTRESARILATLPGFQLLPEGHQRALILAVKYDHAPKQIPELCGEREATQLAMRIISALAQADRTATAAEKDRNLEKLNPADLLWKDFTDYLREAPVVQRGKKGAANQVNNPPESPYLYVYEAPWRDAAVRRLPPEVAAALDLTRRDAGKIAKYTRILAERLRKEGLLVEQYDGKQVSDSNPLWDIQSGTGEKAVVLRGILVLQADALWKALNYRLSTRSPFPVQILAPNADADGNVSRAPDANREQPKTPDVTDGLKLDTSSPDALSALGLTTAGHGSTGADAAGTKGSAAARKRARSFSSSAPPQDDRQLGLVPAEKPARATESSPTMPEAKAPEKAAAPHPEVESTSVAPEQDDEEAAMAAELAAAQAAADQEPVEMSSASTDSALELLAGLGALGGMETESGEADAEPSAPEGSGETREPAVAGPAGQESPATDVTPAQVDHIPTASVPTETPPASSTGERLSMSERRAGIAVADAAAVKAWPHLQEGDKYYTAEAGDVKEGLRPAGNRYEGATQKDSRQKERNTGKPVQQDTRKPAAEPQVVTKSVPAPETKSTGNALGLTDGGPRRRIRRIIN